MTIRLHLSLYITAVLSLIVYATVSGQESQECDPLGWFPTDFGLKDHSVFFFDEMYYIVSIHLPGEKYFAYGRSPDLCNWENLTPVLEQRLSDWDQSVIWAPFVLEEQGIYYMFYTGVKGPYPNFTQSIMLATTDNPADPDSWQQQGMIFQPDHPGMIWQDGTWSDCRDPMVLRVEDTYYLYYTGRDETGGIVGLATADSPYGPWQDWGSILTLSEQVEVQILVDNYAVSGVDWDRDFQPMEIDHIRIPESSTVHPYQNLYYLFYNSNGEYFRIGASPSGPWSDEYRFDPGWAHEVWSMPDAGYFTSYLSDSIEDNQYTVTISQLTWDVNVNPPHPYIGEYIHRHFLPFFTR